MHASMSGNQWMINNLTPRPPLQVSPPPPPPPPQPQPQLLDEPPTWTRIEDKIFEEALVKYPEDHPDRWRLIASELPGKTADHVRAHFDDLVHDVRAIDEGLVELPNYQDNSFVWNPESCTSQISFGSSGARRGDSERKKGTPWTEEEHRLFLIGLERYGKGDWRSISRNVVVSRTPTQVASHAQKYYLRQASMKKERKRASIHDITTTAADTQMVSPSSTNYTSTAGADYSIPSSTNYTSTAGANYSNAGAGGYSSFNFPMQ